MHEVKRAIIMAAGLGNRIGNADYSEAIGKGEWKAYDRYGH